MPPRRKHKQTLVRAYSDRDVTDLLAKEPVLDHYNTQRRVFSKFDKELRTVTTSTDIIIQENLFLLRTNNALFKPITAPLTEQTVMNSRLFQEMQRALEPLDVRIITVAISTGSFINGKTGLRDSISIRHKDFYTNKCFLFAIIEAFNRYSELLRPFCSTLPETVPDIIEQFTTLANDETFLTNLAHLLFNENVLLSLWDIDRPPDSEKLGRQHRRWSQETTSH